MGKPLVKNTILGILLLSIYYLNGSRANVALAFPPAAVEGPEAASSRQETAEAPRVPSPVAVGHGAVGLQLVQGVKKNQTALTECQSEEQGEQREEQTTGQQVKEGR